MLDLFGMFGTAAKTGFALAYGTPKFCSVVHRFREMESGSRRPVSLSRLPPAPTAFVAWCSVERFRRVGCVGHVTFPWISS